MPTSRSSFLLALLALSGCSHDAPGQHAVAAGNDPAPPPAPSATPTQASTASAAPSASAAVLPAKPPTEAGPRLHAKARFAWVQPQPHPSKGWLGYLGLGSSIALKGGSVETARVPNSQSRGGCKAWYAIEPRGYICEGDAATLDADDPSVRAVEAARPQTDSPWPYEYADSTGAVRYVRPPSAAEQRQKEWDLAAHLGLVAKAREGDVHKDLVGIDLSPPKPGRWGEIPTTSDLRVVSPLIREGRPMIANGSTVAWTRELDLDGRTYLLTHDLALVPKDRVRPFPRSEFHGVELGKDVALPVAFFRKTDRPKYHRGADGSFEKTSEAWARLGWVALTGTEQKSGEHTYLETKEPGVWTRADEAQVARKAERPAVVKQAKSGRKTWVDVSVLGGTLVAYEDETPVYATMISPGRGGIPVPGKDPISTASTPTGTFRVDGKFVTATMVSSSNDLLVHTEVQYVQNFHGAHSLHGAYWHDRWGEKKSGGCVNLAPIDAKRLFEWSDPPMPKDWYGLRSLPEFGPATVVVVHK